MFFPNDRSLIIPPPKSILGRSFKTWLRYCTWFTLNPSASAYDVHKFAANAVYDPDVSISGHQPMGFDQLMAFYNHWRVFKSKIHVANCPTSTSNSINQIIGVLLSDDGLGVSSASNLEGLMEDRRRSPDLLLAGNVSSLAIIPPTRCGIVHAFDHQMFFQRPISADSFFGTNGANCSDLAYYEVFGIPPDGGTTDAGTANVLVTIDYEVEFSEPKVLASS